MINIINVKEPINDANILRERAWNKDIEDPIKNVVSIIEEIKNGADVDLLKSIEKFDNVKLESFIVTKEEIKEAYENVTAAQIESIKYMKEKLEKTEQTIINNLGNIKIDSEGIKINKKVIPISRVGCYVPGGKARYPSSVVMCTIPAKVAGVKQIVANITTYEKWKN